MTKWELARYLIDAKKCVDSIMYIEQNIVILKNIGIREKIDSKLSKFYINCCAILDKVFPKKKKELCSTDTIVQRLYYERDKNFAHKDLDYRAVEYNSLSEMVVDLKNQILHLRKLCKEGLPDVITLNFVPHDREVFRFVNGLTADKEDIVNEQKYPLRKDCTNKQVEECFKIFSDTEEIRKIDNTEVKNYATLLENGINDYEGLQNRQDFCIKTNVLFGTDMWCSMNNEAVTVMKELRKLGVIDKYNVPNFEALFNPEIQKKFEEIIDTEKK